MNHADILQALTYIIQQKEKIYAVTRFFEIIHEFREHQHIGPIVIPVLQADCNRTPAGKVPHQQSIYIKGRIYTDGCLYTLPVGSWIGRKHILSDTEWQKLNITCEQIISDIPEKIVEILNK